MSVVKSAWARVRDFVVRLQHDEPLRQRVWPFVLLVSGWFVKEGIVSADVMDYVLAAVALLGGWGLIESARRLVTPVAKAQAVLEVVEDEANNVVQLIRSKAEEVVQAVPGQLAGLPPEVQRAVEDIRRAGVEYIGRRRAPE